jgi:hypothetical protein
MVADYVPIVFLFFIDLFGALVRSLIPWLQDRAANEKTMRELDLIPKDKLSIDQVAFIEKNSKPLNFAGRYVFTTIVGLVATLTITIGAFSLLLPTLPENLTMAVALVMAPGIFLQGYGGTSFSNQLLKSKDNTKDIEKKAMISEIQNVGIVARAERTAATSSQAPTK